MTDERATLTVRLSDDATPAEAAEMIDALDAIYRRA